MNNISIAVIILFSLASCLEMKRPVSMLDASKEVDIDVQDVHDIAAEIIMVKEVLDTTTIEDEGPADIPDILNVDAVELEFTKSDGEEMDSPSDEIDDAMIHYEEALEDVQDIAADIVGDIVPDTAADSGADYIADTDLTDNTCVVETPIMLNHGFSSVSGLTSDSQFSLIHAVGHSPHIGTSWDGTYKLLPCLINTP